MGFSGLRAIFGGCNLAHEVKASCDGFLDSMAQIRQQHQELQSACNEMTEIVNAVGGFLWKKDRCGRYQFANRRYCDRVLTPDIAGQRCSLALNEAERVTGKNDEELFDAFTLRTGNSHSFAQTMETADAHVIETGKSCRFLEVGLIGDNPMMLKSTRTPTFDSDGAFDGIVGFGIDEGEWWPDLRQGLDWYLADANTGHIGPGVYLLGKKQQTPVEAFKLINGTSAVMNRL